LQKSPLCIFFPLIPFNLQKIRANSSLSRLFAPFPTSIPTPSALIVPFLFFVQDYTVTDGGAWSVMTGFNRWGATWCGAYDNLLTGFLRGELGMRGMIITDYSGSSKYMDLADGLIAGSDIWDSPDPTIHTTLAPKYENDAYIVTQMRNAMHHILYTVVNSNAMNGWASTDTLKTITPWWQTAIYALIAVLAVLTILCAWQLSKALKAKKSMVDTAPAADQK